MWMRVIERTSQRYPYTVSDSVAWLLYRTPITLSRRFLKPWMGWGACRRGKKPWRCINFLLCYIMTPVNHRYPNLYFFPFSLFLYLFTELIIVILDDKYCLFSSRCRKYFANFSLCKLQICSFCSTSSHFRVCSLYKLYLSNLSTSSPQRRR